MAGQACLKKLFSQNPPRFPLPPVLCPSPFIEHHFSYSTGSSCFPKTNLPLMNAVVSFENGPHSTDNKNVARLVTMLAGGLSFAGLGLLIKNYEGRNALCQTSFDMDQQQVPVPSITVVDGSKNSRNNFLLTDAYRRRVFFKYERRIRMLSPPEKVFEYFASIRTSEGQSFMTAGDLMRAVVPVFPPSESPIVREGSLQGERSPGELRCPPSQFFMLFDTNGDGLISFSEYIFFLTLLSIPESNFSTAVKMFDLDGNGTIDRDEFKKVMAVMRSHTRQGVVQRDGLRLGLKVDKTVENGGLVEFFFGIDGKKHMRHEDFALFLKELHEEIIRLEFSHYDYWNQGTISARDFGLSMVAAADLSHINQYLDCVDALGNEPSFKNCRISFKEFQNFAELRKQLQPLALAISSYGKTYGLLTKADFQRAASQVCKVPITDQVVDIVFYIFDINRDGNLSMEEFLGVLERRERATADPRDSGLMYFLKCWYKCARSCKNQSKWLDV